MHASRGCRDPSIASISFEEVFVTLAMYQVDGVRIRMPMACAIVAAFVLAVVTLLAVASWVVDPSGSGLDRSSSPETAQTAPAAPSDAPNPARMLEDRGRPGRKF
jgi:hypothetical protein